MNTQCNSNSSTFQLPDKVDSRKVVADFSGGTLTSNAGALLLGLAEQTMRLFQRVAQCFSDHRDPALIAHTLETLVGQRITALALGYEDLNDHDELRKDPVLATVLGQLKPRRKDCAPLAGKSTLNRLELAATGKVTKERKVVVDFEKLDRLLVELFLQDHAQEPEEIVLDLDATDIPLHGDQQGRFFHGYYLEYCYLPLLVFCGRTPLMVRMRSAGIDAAAGVEKDLETLVNQIRSRWSHTRIILRTDSGFCRETILSWCESQKNVEYVIGLARNQRLVRDLEDSFVTARAEAERTHRPARCFQELCYKTLNTWSCSRRVVGKAEVLPGSMAGQSGKDNPRFIVTSLSASTHPGRALYESFYCARGEAENRVKEHKLDLFSKRCSSNLFDANTLRLYLSTFAYILMERIRRSVSGTRLERAQANTLRLRLLKIGARVRISARRIYIAMSSGCPDQDIFALAWKALIPI